MKLKLNLNTSSANVAAAASSGTPTAATPGPAPTPGGSRPGTKIKFKTKSTPSTPLELSEPPKLKKWKAPKPSKPSIKTAKHVESKKGDSKKRDREESGDEHGTIAVQPLKHQPKKIKIVSAKTPKTPIAQTPINFKAKIKGRPLQRHKGEGYDSEASDTEIDPVQLEGFIWRLLPNDDCEYLRQCIVEKKMGVPISQGGPHITFRFFSPDARRVSFNIRGQYYAAIVVDLPTITEAMKSWDKRGWWKSVDICQMILMLAPVEKEEDVRTFPLPKEVNPTTWAYSHGITPPMHYARKRRFRTRANRSDIEQMESVVARLIEADSKAVSSSWQMIDENKERRSQMYSPNPETPGGDDHDEDEYDDEDAEGEEDDTSQQQGYFNTAHHNEGGEDEDQDDELFAGMEKEIEAALEDQLDDQMDVSTPMSTTGATPLASNDNSSALPQEEEEEEDSGDESMEGDDEEDDDVEMGPEERERLAQIEEVKEDIADLEKRIETAQTQIATQQNPILKKRLEDNARKLKAELQIKKSSIGEGDEY
ncbi:hypothetical protein HYFRA_00012635 [Hymenoscyphus fraxineus]|uniref:TAFII55 protein conserved region domain-containing protein n=1 Tax=Hymenoscyphus fraxineus TaxID=746836 RepID=A0A9N9PYF5_9HELO|nr:hypothetical protein HYFRA_00012635 [Hymenoscyphus fraxineus]